MGTPDSREYDRLKHRKFKPYSVGHQRMYLKAMAQMTGPARIFEAGFGIGWGLDQMAGKQGCISEYVGVEPNKDSFSYVAGRYDGNPYIHLINSKFGPAATAGFVAFDYAFCIEVIEHVPATDHLDFLKDLRALGCPLFFSTPDIRVNPKEGVRTSDNWKELLVAAGYPMIDIDTSEWTYLYTCRP